MSTRIGVTASAPGKLVLLGEYVVLEGAPALVAAVARRARVRAASRRAPPSVLTAAALGLTAHPFTITREKDEAARAATREAEAREAGPAARAPAFAFRSLASCSDESGRRLAIAKAALVDAATFVAEQGMPLPEVELTTDTDAFVDASGNKLGFGSSAAIAACLWAALVRAAGVPLPPRALLVERVTAAHRRAQGGAGSGIDVAASCAGGLVRFWLRDPAGLKVPAVESVALPPGLHILSVWTGKATSTPSMLATVRAFAARAKARHRALMDELAAAASGGATAISRGEAAAFLAATATFADGLERLGVESDADIVSEPHRRARQIAGRLGAVYKPSGAGGGDVGVALTDDGERCQRLRAALDAAGLPATPLAIDRVGLSVTDTETETAQ